MKSNVNFDEIEVHLRSVIRSNLVSYDIPAVTIEKITTDLFLDVMQLLETIQFDVILKQ